MSYPLIGVGQCERDEFFAHRLFKHHIEASLKSGVGLGATAQLAAPVVDRFGAPPLFVVSAIGLPLLAFWFTLRLKAR